jgi:hypothetical protein
MTNVDVKDDGNYPKDACVGPYWFLRKIPEVYS